ncbi:CDC48 family AAA ATPase [Candidatus Woesearchaeota archaeon]|nr:CDC48 family AAA ATPase [Candidatus Woesearchaeota archaeon]
MGNEIKLKVAEAIQDDVNKGIVRTDSTLMREIGVKPGDVVEITGEKTTVATIDRAYPGDIGLNILRMDGLLRRNAKTGIGETVTIRAADVEQAKQVTIAPARKDIMVKADPIFFKRGLLGRAVLKGDIISLGNRSQRRRRMPSGSPFFDDIVELLDEGLMGGIGFSDLKFLVIETQPDKAVIIGEDTEIIYNPEAEVSEQETAPEVTYEDIGGLHEEIRKIREMIELPIKHPEVFDRLGIEPPKGVLLHGPPGTGKTLLAKAVANETKSHFLVINGPEIMSKFYGQSEENLRKKFEEAEKNAPSIVFIDEIDAIASKREETHGDVEKRVVAQLLAVMDGLKSRGKVVVIAATNIPNAIDPALRRPGRFDREIEIGVPKENERLQILNVHTRNMPLAPPFDKNSAEESIADFRHKLELDRDHADKEIKSITKEIERLRKDKNNDSKIPGLSTRLSHKEKDKLRLVSKLDELKNAEAKIRKAIESIDPERRLFGLTYVDLKQITEKTLVHIKSEIAKRIEKSDLPHIEEFEKISSIRELKEIIDKLDSEEPRKQIIESVLTETDIDIDSFRFSVQGLIKILPALEEPGLKEYLMSVTEELRNLSPAKATKELNEVLSASWVSEELKEKIKDNLVKDMLAEVAKVTHGFVGADLASLAKESAMIVLRRITADLDDRKGDITKYLDKLFISLHDFKEALKFVRPSAMREVLIEIPDTTWEQVGGLDKVKQELLEAVDWPLKYPHTFERMGIHPPKGVLLYGPPGTGKTLLAKAIAKEAQSNFILVKGPELLSKWVGESEKAVRKIFEKARQTSPSIIFFDEIDSIAPNRGSSGDANVTERVVNQLLTEMDGLIELQDVVILAATNRPDIMDTALLRPGRFDRIILVPAPDQETREKIFKVHTKNIPMADDVVIKDLAKKTEGYAGADIEALCREAAIFALREDLDCTEVKVSHFEKAIKKVRPSITKEIEESYESMQNFFSSAQGRKLANEKPAYFG